MTMFYNYCHDAPLENNDVAFVKKRYHYDVIIFFNYYHDVHVECPTHATCQNKCVVLCPGILCWYVDAK